MDGNELARKIGQEEMATHRWSWSSVKTEHDQRRGAVFITPNGEVHAFNKESIPDVATITSSEFVSRPIWAEGTNYTFDLRPGVCGVDLLARYGARDSFFKQPSFEAARQAIQDRLPPGSMTVVDIESFKKLLETTYPEDYVRFTENERIKSQWQQEGGYREMTTPLQEHVAANESPKRLCLLRQGNLYRFTGSDIPDVIRVANQIHTQNGAWSFDTYEVIIHTDTKENIPTDHRQMTTWYEYQQQLEKNGIAVGEAPAGDVIPEEIKRFLRENFPKVAERFDQTETVLVEWSRENEDDRKARVERVHEEELPDTYIFNSDRGEFTKLDQIDNETRDIDTSPFIRRVQNYRRRQDSTLQEFCYVVHPSVALVSISQEMVTSVESWLSLKTTLGMDDLVVDDSLQVQIQERFPRHYQRFFPELTKSAVEFPADVSGFIDTALDALTQQPLLHADLIEIGIVSKSQGHDLEGDYGFVSYLADPLAATLRDKYQQSIYLRDIKVSGRGSVRDERYYQDTVLQMMGKLKTKLGDQLSGQLLRQVLPEVVHQEEADTVLVILGRYGYLITPPEQRQELTTEKTGSARPKAITRLEKAKSLLADAQLEKREINYLELKEEGEQNQVILAEAAEGLVGLEKLLEWKVTDFNVLDRALRYMQKAEKDHPYQLASTELPNWMVMVKKRLQIYKTMLAIQIFKQNYGSDADYKQLRELVFELLEDPSNGYELVDNPDDEYLRTLVE